MNKTFGKTKQPNLEYEAEECAGCNYASVKMSKCLLNAKSRQNKCRSVTQEKEGLLDGKYKRYEEVQLPRNEKKPNPRTRGEDP